MTLYQDSDPARTIVSTSYTDGLGRALQSHVQLSADSAVVSATVYDGVGRPVKEVKPFPAPSGGEYLNQDVLAAADLYHAARHGIDAESPAYAYTEVRYYNDPLGRMKEVGGPGAAFSLDAGGRHVKQWTLPSSKLGSDRLDADGFLLPDRMVEDSLDKFDLCLTCFEVQAPSYILSVSMSEDGDFSQQLTDVNGLVVATYSNTARGPDPQGDNVVARYSYDVLGNVLTQQPPSDLVETTEFEYDLLGQMVRRALPDVVEESCTYDDAGRLSRVTAGSRTVEYHYDALGRPTSVVANGKAKVVYYYDDVEELQQTATMKWLGIPAGILGGLGNLYGRAVAVGSIDESGMNRVVDLFGYDDLGRVSIKYKVIPSVPLQKFTYGYDRAGKVLWEEYANGTDVVVKNYEYDRLGRLLRVTSPVGSSTIELAKYEYDNEGLLTRKALHNGAHPINYAYNMQGRLKRIVSGQFVEQIEYESPPSSIGGIPIAAEPKFGGGISAVAYSYPTLPPPDPTTGVPERNYVEQYTYDGLSRLTATASSSQQFGGNYEYDVVGRFARKQEGETVVDGYTYYDRSSRLKAVNGDTRTFAYDEQGNTVVDYRKNCITQYDWRNLPVRFRFYDRIPSEIGVEASGTYTLPSDYAGTLAEYMEHRRTVDKDVKLISEVTMVYDAGGNRVLKLSSR